jgi:hypothetical protein
MPSRCEISFRRCESYLGFDLFDLILTCYGQEDSFCF